MIAEDQPTALYFVPSFGMMTSAAHTLSQCYPGFPFWTLRSDSV
jgi:hypothetical protein